MPVNDIIKKSVSSEQLVQKYSGLVKQIVYHLWSRLPKVLERDDLIQAGMIGLIEAGRRYQADRGAHFKTYASIRIRGAILDEVRRYSWPSRSAYEAGRRINSATKRVENIIGCAASGQAIAAELGVSLEEYGQLRQIHSQQSIAYIEDIGGTDNLLAATLSEPENDASYSDTRLLFQKAVAQLSEQQQLVFHFYYSDGLKLREIGQRMGVSESRACQIFQTALKTIQARISS